MMHDTLIRYGLTIRLLANTKPQTTETDAWNQWAYMVRSLVTMVHHKNPSVDPVALMEACGLPRHTRVTL